MLLSNEAYTVSVHRMTTALPNPSDALFDLSGQADAENVKLFSFCVKGKRDAIITMIGDNFSCIENCAVLKGNLLTVLLGNRILQIDLNTLHAVQSADVELFGHGIAIYPLNDGYLVYCDSEIAKYDVDFQIVWRFSGKDVFISPTGDTTLMITETSIKLLDFEDNFYELDFDGNLIKFI